MNFTTVCYVFEIPPLSVYYTRYDMELLSVKGYQIIAYDLSPVLHPIAYERGKIGLLDERQNTKVYHIHSKIELKKLLKQQTQTFYCLTFAAYSDSYPLIKEISKYHYGFACNVDYAAPVPVRLRMQSVDYWTKWSWNRIKRAIFARLPKKYLPVRKADVVITYSEERLKEMLNNTLWNRKTQIMLTNTLDYNECLRAKKKKNRIINEEYCLFIDQFLPWHPDGKEVGICINADEYYREIRSFLKYVSEITGKKVVIAGHPKGNYALYPQCFEKYEVIQFCTCELVKDAALVMAHTSMSLSFVSIFCKPLLLLTTNDFENISSLKKGLIATGMATQHDIINISNVSSKEMACSIVEEEMRKDTKTYEEQKLRYCLDEKQENSKLQFGEVLIKAMLRI